jgi:hypothetical protein
MHLLHALNLKLYNIVTKLSAAQHFLQVSLAESSGKPNQVTEKK